MIINLHITRTMNYIKHEYRGEIESGRSIYHIHIPHSDVPADLSNDDHGTVRRRKMAGKPS